MTDWRYWVTYAGRVQADTEAQAQVAAIEKTVDQLTTGVERFPPLVEVEEIENV